MSEFIKQVTLNYHFLIKGKLHLKKYYHKIKNKLKNKNKKQLA